MPDAVVTEVLKCVAAILPSFRVKEAYAEGFMGDPEERQITIGLASVQSGSPGLSGFLGLDKNGDEVYGHRIHAEVEIILWLPAGVPAEAADAFAALADRLPGMLSHGVSFRGLKCGTTEMDAKTGMQRTEARISLEWDVPVENAIMDELNDIYVKGVISFDGYQS